MTVRTALLLRGVNVGGHDRVSMARLRELGEQRGGPSARTTTYRQSGNLALTVEGEPADAAETLRKTLAADGLDVAVLVRTGPELAAVVAANPLGAPADPARLFVSFCLDPVGDAVAGLDAAAYAPELFGVVSREIYTWVSGGMHSASLSSAFWQRRLSGAITTCNWRTVLALADLTAPAC